MNQKIWAFVGLAIFVGLMALQVVIAADFNQPISDQDKQAFDQMLEPILRIYSFAKYTATVIAVLVLLFAGIKFVAAGGDPKKREDAKSMIMYVAIGLAIIWAAPFAVRFVTGE
jgi:type IV secretory pathway VirB2 component (pilin)